jgi:hypothetical protein
MSHPVCQTCPYWDPITDEGSTFGHCRVNPPVAIPWTKDAAVVAQWPVTFPTHWCSSHPQSREWVAAWETEQIQRGREAEEDV